MSHRSPISRLRTRLRWELAIVLALSFGASALYAILSITERLTREAALNTQTATINRSLSERPWFDLASQLLSFITGLAPVALVIWLTWSLTAPHLRRLGLGAPRLPQHAQMNRRVPWWISEPGWGIALAALIGIPGIVFYLGTKAIGLNVTVVPTALDTHFWTAPVLILLALKAAVTEELIVVAYLFNRLRLLGCGTLTIIVSSALLRGSYHLYQGFGGFAGNVVMGLVFGWVYHRYGRALPLVIAHWALDIASFVGYPLALALWPTLFGVAQ